ncbi:hypothetical protein [Ferruginibacter sp. HRS2-29]|uniref:hypothetical protein n=1 Tax=Ferruginibacter sp. HRS2-29 TaxID=2487334 RepID=UPI0020CC625C|nr:hypothetical protein [Ferruginibacter sp. HRS2-29]MCP9751836.1 hypothetical protein [Ferruginibacter sp. HRS2-29]
MLFNLFGKKERKINFTDINYMSAKAKCEAVLRLAKQEPGTIFLAWFPDTAMSYKQAFSREGIPESRILETRQFHSAKVAGKKIVFLEHHPLPSKETALVKDLEETHFNVYNSLDEPLFAVFGSDRIIDLMKKMGLKEDEAVSHTLISRSVKNAQEKIEKKVSLEIPANSQKEWMDKNVK